MNADACPTDEELYAVLAGEGSPTATAHVGTCAACRAEIHKLQSESTILRHVGEQSRSGRRSPSMAEFPGAIGKFIVVGIWDDRPDFITYRGLHAVVRREVLIQVAKSPHCQSGSFREAFRATVSRWMQPRPQVARVLDAGEFESRPYLVVEFIEGVRLDRFAGDERLKTQTLMRIFGQVAQTLASKKTPHPLLDARSIVIDDANRPTLIDWAATAEFALPSDDATPVSDNITPIRLATAFCATVLPENFSAASRFASTTTPDLAAALRSHQVPALTAETMAKAVFETGAVPTVAEMSKALLLPISSGFWKRLFANILRKSHG